MNDWLEYEKLAARIYAELQPDARVIHNDMIRGKISGIERQIDVSIRDTIAGHEILVIVQAKNRTRPADVNVVGEFASVVEDVCASKGVLICNAGFTSSAMEYARNKGIDLCSLHDAQSRDWSLDLKIPLLWIECKPSVNINLSLIPDATNTEEVSHSTNPYQWIFSSDGGKTKIPILDIFVEKWNAEELDRTPDIVHTYIPEPSNIRFFFNTGFSVPVDIIIEYTVARKIWWRSFTLADARGILNQIDNKLTAKFHIRNTDIPLSRDDSWILIEDPNVFAKVTEGFHIVIEQSYIPFRGLQFSMQPLDSE